MTLQNNQREIAKTVLSNYGILNLTELNKLGVYSNTIYQMVENCEVNRLARGLYQLETVERELHHNLAVATKKFPKSVVCLLSALSYYDFTDHIPNKTWLALPMKKYVSRETRLDIEVVHYTDPLFFEQYVVKNIEGVPVKIFSASKTIIDCFRFHKKIGLDFAIEGLTNALQDELVTERDLERFAKIYGIWHTMQPYLDAAVSRLRFLNRVNNHNERENFS